MATASEFSSFKQYSKTKTHLHRIPTTTKQFLDFTFQVTRTIFNMFTKAAIVSAIAGLAVATLIHPTPVHNPNIFAVIINHSGSPIQGLGVNAKDYNFNVNNGTGTYCLSGQIDCSKGMSRSFFGLSLLRMYNANGQLQMAKLPSLPTIPLPKPSPWTLLSQVDNVLLFAKTDL